MEVRPKNGKGYFCRNSERVVVFFAKQWYNEKENWHPECVPERRLLHEQNHL